MTARILEQGGIATVIIGSAMDIVEHCGVPRFVYNDLPLGNPLGAPGDVETQVQSVLAAMHLIVNATEPAVIETEVTWDDDDAWKDNYMKITAENRDELRTLGEENRRKRAAEIAAGLRRRN